MLYQELQPVDTYTIKLATPFSDYDRQLLTLFYQPLTGPEAMSLYLTIWADIGAKEDAQFTHYHLMNTLTMPLSSIFQARISLEAIGLLRTYTKTEGDQRSFIYELLPPMDANHFFHDPLLATFLLSKIGEQAYRNLRSRFVTDEHDLESYKEVSRNFLDVYTPVNGHAHELQNDEPLVGRQNAPGVPFDKSHFDFDLMMSGLSEQMVPRDSLAGIPRELIAKLAFLYSLSPLDMQKIIMMALDEKLEVSEERLRKSTIEFYKMNISKNVPKLDKQYVTEKLPEKAPTTNPKTKEQQMIEYFESISPKDMLRDTLGVEPFPINVQLAERLINVHKLPFSVVNVLLHYIILRNDGNITAGFAEQVASEWAYNKIDTAEKAIQFSRKKSDDYSTWKKEGKPSGKSRNKNTREEKVPEWFKKLEEEPTVDKKTDEKEQIDIDKKRRELMAKLEAMRKGVK